MSLDPTTAQTLRAVLDDLASKGERLAHPRVRDIVSDVCLSLGSLHAGGGVHGAVHPGNIRLESEEATLSDNAPALTSAYMSPEQAAGFPPDSRSDLYSLGIILYEMLAGQPPFTADTDLALTLHHLNTPVPPIAAHLPQPNPAIDSLLQKALAKNADERYQTAQELSDALAQIFGRREAPEPGMPTLRQHDPMPEQAASAPTPAAPGKRRSTLLLIGAVLVIGVILFAIFSRPAEVASPALSTPTTTQQTKAADFTSTFAPDDPTNAAWPQTDSGSVARVITPDGLYHFQSEIPASAITSVYGDDVRYTDATITLEGRLDANSPAASGYGIVFRYVDDRNYNVFAVDGAGRFSIWELKGGSWTELRGADENWTPHASVNERGIDNVLSVTLAGGHFVGSVNDQIVADVSVDDPVESGGVGIYLATTRSGQADIYINTYQVTTSP